MTRFDRPSTVNEACTHPKVTHRHGTYTCYVTCGCRCDECRPVAVAYRREEVRLKSYRKYATDDRYEPYVDASPARAHVQVLAAAGLGHKRIAALAGVAASAVGALLWETPSRGRGRRQQVRRETAAKLLAVPVPAIEELAAGRKVDPIPTRNRVQALGRLGYSVGAIAREAGLDRQTIDHVLRGAPSTTVRTHNAVREVFRRLWSKPCDPDEWRAKIAASRTRRRADEEGWPSPLDLDDDGFLEDLDDDTHTRGADLDEWKHLVLAGENPARAASRCGVKVDTIEAQARRVGRTDVLQLISRTKAVA